QHENLDVPEHMALVGPAAQRAGSYRHARIVVCGTAQVITVESQRLFDRTRSLDADIGPLPEHAPASGMRLERGIEVLPAPGAQIRQGRLARVVHVAAGINDYIAPKDVRLADGERQSPTHGIRAAAHPRDLRRDTKLDLRGL